MSDNLYNGQKLRCLTIVDNHTRISPTIGVGFRYTACNVIETLNQAVNRYGKPECIRVDNGPEFISKELDLWSYARGVQLDFSRPGKPTDNAFIESFNSRFRQECLNQHWFLSLEDAQEKIEAWCILQAKSVPVLRSKNVPPCEHIHSFILPFFVERPIPWLNVVDLKSRAFSQGIGGRLSRN